ncbi:hypothetical protein L332_08260 [Agrococcus pavilionensis RW1]|uniref:Uncharacterized protein n=1 Tax=Agrococcus pavilionensis RW1 TaxID=1330458 RepID=U1MR82_9MICO|nr:hypothetical protein L332_08260 [Agrococcus pavilionensis RW1]
MCTLSRLGGRASRSTVHTVAPSATAPGEMCTHLRPAAGASRNTVHTDVAAR